MKSYTSPATAEDCHGLRVCRETERGPIDGDNFVANLQERMRPWKETGDDNRCAVLASSLDVERQATRGSLEIDLDD